MTPLLREPWAILESALEVIVAIASRDEFFADARVLALQAEEGTPLKNTHKVEIRDGVAIIPVSGPLFRHADMFSAISGATSYETLRKDLESALSSPTVHAILFNVDSPGGEVFGTGELSAAIFAARGKKPLVAYVGGAMASAAYWIGSAVDEIVVDASAMLGSIGVRTLMIDDAKKDEIAGVKKYAIVSSQSPFKVADAAVESDRARMQATVSSLAAVFVADVARNRGVSAEKVLKNYGRGDVLIGQDAVDAGLADRVGSFESVLAELSARRLTTFKGATAMSDYTQEECDECMEGQAKSKAALGLDIKATAEQMIARASALLEFEQKVIAATGATTAAEALGRIASSVTATAELATIKTELAREKAEGVRRDLRATLEAGLDNKKLSLGAIQKSIPLVLRGEQKAAWLAAFADGELESVTKEAVLNAACSVAISTEDLAAIAEFAKSSAPMAAEPFVEPIRDTAKESADLDTTALHIKQLADQARATLDRNKPAVAAK